MSAIEWTHDGEKLLVDAIIFKPDVSSGFDGVAAKALIDTGSTTSGIARSIADRLGLVGRGKRPLSSAGGDIQSQRYLFSVGLVPDAPSVPSFPFVFDAVIGFELTNAFSFEALIGMDILRHCDLQVRRTRLCTLSFGR